MSSTIDDSKEIMLALWGKKDRKETAGLVSSHPLICHMLDTAAVAKLMLVELVPRRIFSAFCQALGVNEKILPAWIGFWAGIHDIGKATPFFQGKWQKTMSFLEKRGFRFKNSMKGYHGTATACMIIDSNRGEGSAGKWLAATLGGHHGVFPRAEDITGIRGELNNVPTYQIRWKPVIKALIDLLAEEMHVVGEEPTLNGNEPSLVIVLAGLVSVADWIASDKNLFPYAGEHVDLEAYITDLERKAREALTTAGWMGWDAGNEALEFSMLFPGKHPRPLQRKTIEIAEKNPGTGIVIIEAPMGEGKTEAAMYLADHWAITQGQTGYFFALPTQATSDQMFTRVRDFLKQRYPGEVVALNLVHGHAAISKDLDLLKKEGKKILEMASIDGEPGYDGAEAAIVSSEWFSYRKRGLLCPFGVGTVDQCLLGILQTRHYFVRLFGMAGKTVIIDEVHAYDVYMTTLLELLLQWLALLGSSVVLLSATLPDARRKKLLGAYAKGAGIAIPDQSGIPGAYPAITYILGGVAGAEEFNALRTVIIKLVWMSGEIHQERVDSAGFPLASALDSRLAAGGCAAVICNTVKKAQLVYKALNVYFQDHDERPELLLFHAHFIYEDRASKQDSVLKRLGPLKDNWCTPGRPKKFILVATQVIEQSLDVDFDLMVTELAPADLIFQRAGRLFRHDRFRPRGLLDPELWILEPRLENGQPKFGASIFVYAKYILLRTWLALRALDHLDVPGDIRPMIELIYGDRECPDELSAELRSMMKKSRDRLVKKQASYAARANANSISPPGSVDDIIEKYNTRLEEDDPTVHVSLQALTRISGPSIPVVVLYPGEDPAKMPVNDLLLRSMQVTDRRIVKILKQWKTPEELTRSVLLRHHKVLQLDDASEIRVDPFVLHYDDDLGLEIEGMELANEKDEDEESDGE